jgi:steroid delta-isomerase-like uncharacterized protein
MSSNENKKNVQRIIDSYNRNRLEIIDELFDKNYVYHGIGEESQASRDEWKMFLQKMRKAFPDQKVYIHDLVAEGDKVAYRMTVEGTHGGELQGIPPTGRKVTIQTVGIMKFKDGKLVEEWENIRSKL